MNTPTVDSHGLVLNDPSGSFEAPSIFRPRRASRQLWLSGHQISQLRFLSEASYPFEACGLLIGRERSRHIEVLDIVQARNLDRRSRDRYQLDPEDLVATDREARRQGLEIVGIWHSHPNHPSSPSATDVAEAWDDYSYVIVSVDSLGDTVVASWRVQHGELLREDIHVTSV